MLAKWNKMRLDNTSNFLTDEQSTELARLFRPDLDPKAGKLALRRLLRNDLVKGYADFMLAQSLSVNDVTIDFCIKKRLDILKKAEDAEQYNNALRALEGFEDFLKLHPKEAPVTRTIEGVSIEDLTNEIQEIEEVIETKEDTESTSQSKLNIELDKGDTVSNGDTIIKE